MRLKFGKFHGLALMLLGLVLLSTQLWLVTRERPASPRAQQRDRSEPQATPHPTLVRLPAILGSVALVAGFVVILSDQSHRTP